jgi:hypothetical protein
MKTLSCGDYRLNLVEYPKGYNRVLPFRTMLTDNSVGKTTCYGLKLKRRENMHFALSRELGRRRKLS